MANHAVDWRCGACGRGLQILWPVRSVVCSCGARLTQPADAEKVRKTA